MHKRVLASLCLLGSIALLSAPALGQDVAKLEKTITTFQLDNGLRFIVAERHDAPVFTYFSMARAGGVNEVPGITGLAHMFEHMAFKGTDKIGTKDFKKESKALEAVDEAHAAWWEAKVAKAPEAKLDELWQAFKDAQEAAGEYVETNEFGSIIEKAGGTGLNAFTTYDVTGYFYNLPSNKLELWAYLESERFEHPVLREFYKERDVVMEERRMRTESSPVGRLIEEFLGICYLGHPYGQPLVGHISDLKSFTRQDAIAFYKKNYVPGNIVMCLVGDVNPDEVQELAQKYFKDWEKAPVPEPVRTVEPPQRGERTVTIRDPGQPILAMAYHKPDISDPDTAVYDVLTALVANGRSSRLHQRLVKDEKKAIAVGAITEIPGRLYPGLFLLFAVPAKGVTAADCEASVLEEIDKLKKEPVPATELEAVVTRMKADRIRELRSNQGFASALLEAEVLTGDWHKALTYTLELEAVTPADLQRVAQKTFTYSNRSVGSIVTEKGEDDAS
jgi:predicted Zn-dependent peptidase